MTNTIAILLVALGQFESGNNDHARGKAGEVSRYQILRPYWLEVTNSRNWTSPVQARVVAERILTRRIDHFVRSTHRLPRADEVYALWNKPGWFEASGWRIDKLPAVTRGRCKRFKNLVDSVIHKRATPTPSTQQQTHTIKQNKAVDNTTTNRH